MGRPTGSAALSAGDDPARTAARGADELVERAQAGDHDAYAALVTTHFERVLRMARALTGNDADARDATQDAFVAVWRGLPNLRDRTRFEPWLHQVVRNRCRDLLRRRRRVREIALDGHDVVVDDPGATSLDRTVLLAAFDRLSMDERRILVLHHLEALPVAEVGRQLGIPVGTVKSRLFAARRSLRRAMEGP
jgi:RNA polymerase sigma-70 factor (ECF subfamily)